MGGSSGSQPTNQTVTQSSIPQEFYPYLQNIMGSAQGVASRPYEAYTGQRLSDFSTDTKQAFDMNRDNVGSWMPGVQAGTNAVGAGINATQSAIGNIPNSSSLQNYQMSAPQVGSAPQAAGVGNVSTGQWGQGAAQQYMSPYINNVLNTQMQQAMRAYGQDRAGIAQSAESAGAYGGSRQAVAEQMANNNQMQQLQALQANSLNTGYNNAQNMYTSDQGRGLQADIANQNSALQTQALNMNSNLNTNALNNNAQLSTNSLNMNSNLQTQDLGARMDMQGVQTGLQGAAQLGTMGGEMAGLGQTYSDLNNSDADRLAAQGNHQEQLNQASDDIGYEEFQNQQNYDKNNLGWEAAMLQGLPTGINTTATTNTTTNPFSQMVGAGIGAAGLYKNFVS